MNNKQTPTENLVNLNEVYNLYQRYYKKVRQGFTGSQEAMDLRRRIYDLSLTGEQILKSEIADFSEYLEENEKLEREIDECKKKISSIDEKVRGFKDSCDKFLEE